MRPTMFKMIPEKFEDLKDRRVDVVAIGLNCKWNENKDSFPSPPLR